MKESDGISKKIDSQIKSMRQSYDVTFYGINLEKVIINDRFYKSKSKPLSYFDLLHYMKKSRFDVMYVRNLGGTSALYFLLISFFIKRTKVVIEIPTYPFDGEGNKGIKSYIMKLIRYFYRFTVDKIVYIGEKTDTIWGIPSVQIDNGIDVSHYRLHSPVPYTGAIHCIGVASIANWHGYDRMIDAINKSELSCIFHIVGDGPELKKLRAMVRDNKRSQVIFHGFKDGEELDDIFDLCHFAIDSLARHRAGISHNSSLKSKEYTARGIPFIKSHIDDSFESSDFVFNVLPDESVIDLNDIVDWYLGLNCNRFGISLFAKNNLTWDKQIEKIGF